MFLNNAVTFNINTFLEEMEVIDRKYESYDFDLFEEDNHNTFNFWQMYEESTLNLPKLFDEDTVILTEGFKLDIKKVLNKNRDPKKEEAKLNAKKKLIKNKFGIDCDKIIKGYTGEINDIKKSISHLNLENAEDYKIAEKILNNKFTELFGKFIADIGQNIGGFIERHFSTETTGQKVLVSFILAILSTLLTLLISTLLIAIAGFVGGVIASCVVQPIISEISRYVASEYIDKNDKFSTYNTSINAVSFTFKMIGSIINPLVNAKKAIIVNLLPVIINSVNTYIVRHAKEENRSKVVLITLIINAAFNAVIVILGPQLTRFTLKKDTQSFYDTGLNMAKSTKDWFNNAMSQSKNMSREQIQREIEDLDTIFVNMGDLWS